MPEKLEKSDAKLCFSIFLMGLNLREIKKKKYYWNTLDQTVLNDENIWHPTSTKPLSWDPNRDAARTLYLYTTCSPKRL